MFYIRLLFLFFLATIIKGSPHIYNPYYNVFRYHTPYYNNIDNYASQIPTYSPFIPAFSDSNLEDRATAAYLSTPDVLPTLNILAEVPYSVSTKFKVVPMLVVTKENMNMLSDDAHVMQISKEKPAMTVKTQNDELIQCTPAVKIELDQPIVIYSLKSTIFFPSRVDIKHGGIKIPFDVGAIIAPVHRGTFISTHTPAAVNVVYAVPTKPFDISYHENRDAIIIPDTEAVVVESEDDLPPKNITILEFPDKEAEPILQVDENDDELVNRNPPQVLAPGGIVQSTQPQASVQPFQNSKESPILIALREEAKKRAGDSGGSVSYSA